MHVIVFAGALKSLTKDEAENIVRKNGGRTTSQPSSKTTHVVHVAGSQANRKLELAKKHNVPIISEKEFLCLFDTINIAGRSKCVVEPFTISKDDTENILKLDNFLGTHNRKIIISIIDWLRSFDVNKLKYCFLSGPAGVGKTSGCYFAVKESGYNIIEINASDTRSKKALQKMLEANNTQSHQSTLTKVKNVYVFDEIDGISGNCDIGGMAYIGQFIKKTRSPVICICNNVDKLSLRLLADSKDCLRLKMIKIPATEYEGHVRTIAEKEGMSLSQDIVDQIVKVANGDIRQCLISIQNYKHSLISNYEKHGKGLSIKESQKNITRSSKDTHGGAVNANEYEVTSALFNPDWFKRTTIDQKVDALMINHNLIPSMVQENYLHTILNNVSMNTISETANLISECSLMNDKFYGSDGHESWQLLPNHLITSCIQPVSYLHNHTLKSNAYMRFPQELKLSADLQKKKTILKEEFAASKIKNPSTDLLTITFPYLSKMNPKEEPSLYKGLITIYP